MVNVKLDRGREERERERERERVRERERERQRETERETERGREREREMSHLTTVSIRSLLTSKAKLRLIIKKILYLASFDC